MCYSENKLSSVTTLSHWTANGLCPLMPPERHLKNMAAEKTHSHLDPSLFARVTNKPEKGELQVSVVVTLESK